jgi:hypothetical protein
MQVTMGPDGFLATEEVADYAAHVILSDYLRARQETGGTALERVLPRLRKELSKRELVSLIRAIHARIAWIASEERALSEPRRWQEFLAQLLRNLYAPSLPFEEADLIRLLEGHRRYSMLWSFGPEELVGAFLATRDLSPALANELRRFQAELKGGSGQGKYQSQASYQSAVQQVHMMLWHDEGDALDPARCWSDLVRGDLRAMTGAGKAAWKALFRHIKGNAPAKPSPSWRKEGEKRLAAIGLDEFRERFTAWLAPFESGAPQALSVAGSHVLRGLLWYAALAGDPRIAATALVLLDAKWKAKRNVDKAMVALVAVLETLAPAEAWPALVRLQQQWPTTSGQIERLLKKIAAALGIGEEELAARGLLHERDLDAATAKIMVRLNNGPIMVRQRRGRESASASVRRFRLQRR